VAKKKEVIEEVTFMLKKSGRKKEKKLKTGNRDTAGNYPIRDRVKCSAGKPGTIDAIEKNKRQQIMACLPLKVSLIP
jgi:hypothetical protein